MIWVRWSNGLRESNIANPEAVKLILIRGRCDQALQSETPRCEIKQSQTAHTGRINGLNGPKAVAGYMDQPMMATRQILVERQF